MPIGSTRPGRKLGARNLKTKHPEDARLDGETETDWGARRRRQAVYRHRAANKASVDDRRRALYAENGPGEAKLAWRSANSEKVKAYSRSHFDRNRDVKIANLKAWTKANPERHKAAQLAWQAANPERWKMCQTTANIRGRTMRFQSVPVWADWKEIWKFYYLAKAMTKKTGIPHQVDHIVPLKGKNVSGLHVHWNLRVITATENRIKRNKFAEAA